MHGPRASLSPPTPHNELNMNITAYEKIKSSCAVWVSQHARYKHAVDDVDDTIGRQQVFNNDGGDGAPVAMGRQHKDAVALVGGNRQIATLHIQRRQFQVVGQRRGLIVARNAVKQEHVGQPFRMVEQLSQEPAWEAVERGIGGSKQGEWPGTREGRGKIGDVYALGQGRELQRNTQGRWSHAGDSETDGSEAENRTSGRVAAKATMLLTVVAFMRAKKARKTATNTEVRTGTMEDRSMNAKLNTELFT